MLQSELKLRRDKIRALMAEQKIDAALITCNVNLIYTFGQVVKRIFVSSLGRACPSVCQASEQPGR